MRKSRELKSFVRAIDAENKTQPDSNSIREPAPGVYGDGLLQRQISDNTNDKRTPTQNVGMKTSAFAYKALVI
jgi:hypothetical protein